MYFVQIISNSYYEVIYRLLSVSTCDYMCHLLGSVIFFGGQMAVDNGEDIMLGSAVKSTCAYIYHMLGLVNFGSGHFGSRGWMAN